jgi:tetratricopeptide (TPR) repeat protein
VKSASLRCAVILILVVCGARVAASAEAEDRAAAKAAFVEGRRLYDVGEYRSALAAFKKAYLHYEDPSFLFNIAQCHRQLGEKVEALKAYRAYLLRSNNPPNRAEVQGLIMLLKTAIADEARAKQAPPPPENIAPPSEHQGPPERAEEAPPPAPAPAPPTTSAPPERAEAAPVERKQPVYKKWWLWTTIAGVAVVGAGVGLAVYYSTRSQFDSTLPGFAPGSALTVKF